MPESRFHLHCLLLFLRFPLMTLNIKNNFAVRILEIPQPVNKYLVKVELPAVNYYHKVIHLGCCSSLRYASAAKMSLFIVKLLFLGFTFDVFIVSYKQISHLDLPFFVISLRYLIRRLLRWVKVARVVNLKLVFTD